ncbi:MAG: thiolase family protein [Chloroflexi bacterium]|nr:thiolase family protein [Chloroflexota bacterium]
MREVVVAGVGLTRFGQFADRTYIDHGVEAVVKAQADAGLGWSEIQRAYCGASGIGPFAGNRVGHELGLTGAPIVNLDNASASGNSAFHQAFLAVATEQCDVALAMGVGQLGRTMLNAAGSQAETRKYLAQAYGNAMTIFALAARRRMHEYGTSPEIFGRIAVKSKLYGALNPNSHIQRKYSLDEVMAARPIASPLTLPMCCPVGDGGAAAILTTRRVAERLGQLHPVRVTASLMKGEVFQQASAWSEGNTLAVAAREMYEMSGVGPSDLDVIQLHDATSSEELDYYERLGLCREGEADAMVLEGATGPGGRIPVNTDGGLTSRGHPLGPTGLAQVHEIVLQLRGDAGDRQVAGAKTGLVQQTGAGAVCFMHLLQR